MTNPVSQKWPGDRAILFVHGVGNSTPGSYAPLVDQVKKILGADANNIAIYFFYYDQVNEWFSQKQQAALAFTKVSQYLSQLFGNIPNLTTSTTLGNAAAGFGGDVIWPVLLADGRLAVRASLLAQMQQVLADGIASGVSAVDQRVSIIGHSMGCFHVYEALSYAAITPSQGLAPATTGNQYANVILMASPVQLIRTVASNLGAAVPQRESIYTVSKPSLDMPSQAGADGTPMSITSKLISITGNLDPVGGYFFRHQYAYMSIPGQVSYVDQQQVASVGGNSEELSLASLLQSALQNDGAPTITPDNPHDWSAYITRHADDLKGWLS